MVYIAYTPSTLLSSITYSYSSIISAMYGIAAKEVANVPLTMDVYTATPGEHLAGLRRARGLSLRAAAKLSGLSHTYIMDLENKPGALAGMSLLTLEKLARAYGVNKQHLEQLVLGKTDLSKAHDAGLTQNTIPGGLLMVPVVGVANGGKPHDYAIPVKHSLVRPSTRAFCVEGNSMDDGSENSIRDGDWVLVDTSLTDRDNGRVYLVEIFGDGMTVKRLRRVESRWVFLSDNPGGESIRESDALIIGQVYARVSYGKVR